MKSFTFLTALAVTSSASAVSVRFPNLKAKAEVSAVDTLSASNSYGSPLPPWEAGSKPGWYFGDNPGSAPGVPWLKDSGLCVAINRIPDSVHCPTFPLNKAARAFVNARMPTPQDVPPTPPGPAPATTSQEPPPPPPPAGVYDPVFTGLTGAIQADDYMTFGLVDSVNGCQKMCDSVSGCGFFNTYHDVNGKDGSPLLTCSLYRSCHGASQATNTGGQSQPDGSLNFITNSDGYCRTS